MFEKKKSPKFLHISKYYPPVAGGIETTARDIAEGLYSRGFFIEVVCANNRAKKRCEKFFFPVTRLSSWGEVAKTPFTPSLIINLLMNRSSFDVIHVHLPNPMANLALFFSRPKSKVILHWHSDIVKQKFLLKLYEPFQRWLINRADAIIATSPPYAVSSPWLKSSINKVYFTPSCIRDPLNAMTSEEIQQRARRIREKFPGKKIVFSLGRMTYYKGFDVLLKSAKLLDNDTIVLLGGEGELLSELKATAVKLGVSRKVFFVGRISEDDLPGYYGAADVFCLPSLMRSEAFGLVMVEAMSYGIPIVATRISGSGVPWVNLHGETGLNTKPGDEVELASALSELLNDPLRSKSFGEAGRRRFESNFTIDKMIDSVLSTYRKFCVF